MVAEEQGADLVVVEDGAEAEHGGYFRDALALGLPDRAEQAGPAHIHQQHHGEFAFLFEHLHVGAAQAGGYVPVHAAYVVAPLVLTHFAEGHTASLECGMVLSGEDLVTQRLGLYLDLPDLLY